MISVVGTDSQPQAPTAPPRKSTKTPSRLSKHSSSSPNSPRTIPAIPASQDTFSNSKEDRRRVKRSVLVSRIEKAHSKPLKRRRPSKKLVTTLESLVDALPETTATGTAARGDDAAVVDGVKVSSGRLKSRPGATKRKQRLEKLERERFERNLAQMATGAGNQGTGTTDSSSRWAALKTFIQTSLEKEQKAEGS